VLIGANRDKDGDADIQFLPIEERYATADEAFFFKLFDTPPAGTG
jgi:hypothetical protein